MVAAADVIKVLGNHILVDNEAIVVDTKRSQGSWLVDARTGKQYLDCFSQFASQPLGWNHPKLLGNRELLADVAVHKVANSDMYCTEYAKFVQTFASITPDFSKYFFICGGALAVENALKVAFDWKMKRAGWTDDEHANNLKVIHLKEAFHGRSGYTMSLTNNNDLSNPKVWGFPKFNWVRIDNPKIYFSTNGPGYTNRVEQIALLDAENALKQGNVAAIIAEPIQGEGGDNHFRPEFFKALRKLADQYDALLIMDEVQTGVGLTGEMWAYEHHNIKPDIIAVGKKVQVCGIAVSEKVASLENGVFKVQSRINSTWGGNLVDMVRSRLQIEVIKEDRLVDNAKMVGEYFVEQLHAFDRKFFNIRGKGLMIAVDLETKEKRDEFLARLSENVLALPCGTKSIRFRPHLTFTKEDVDQAIAFIKSSIPSV